MNTNLGLVERNILGEDGEAITEATLINFVYNLEYEFEAYIRECDIAFMFHKLGSYAVTIAMQMEGVEFHFACEAICEQHPQFMTDLGIPSERNLRPVIPIQKSNIIRLMNRLKNNIDIPDFSRYN